MATVTIVQHRRPGQNDGPGSEPRAVRHAWDTHLRGTAGEREEAEASQKQGIRTSYVCAVSWGLLNLPVFVRVIPRASYQ